jgi:hypothetical protein
LVAAGGFQHLLEGRAIPAEARLGAARLDVLDAVLLASVHDDALVRGVMLPTQSTFSP